MSLTLRRGQKTDLTKTNPGLSNITVALGWDTGSNIEIDAAAFLLQKSGKCRGDEDFIFYGNPDGRNNSVKHSGDIENSSDKAQLNVNLTAVPQDVEKIAFTLTIYEGPQRGHNFGQISSSYIRIDEKGGKELLRFNMGKDFNSETAIVAAELYRHNGEWKFNPVASGYQGGLAALCGGFGIVVSDQPTDQAQKEAAPTVEKPREQPKVNLQKIELKKKGEKISLQKKSNNMLGEILVNLNWNQRRQEAKGLFNKLLGTGSNGIDLDLGCLFELKNELKGVVQSLGNSFGSLNSKPYIELDGDDRTGQVSGGENLRINGNKISEINRILVFAYIYKGAANWAQADGIVTIKQPDGPDIIVKLDDHDSRKIMCAVAMIENVNNETFSIERLVRYYSGHKEMDKAHNWGMRWTTGSKD